MFDDCRGDKFVEMMTGFSKVVLRRALVRKGEEGRNSIARGLCKQDTQADSDNPSSLPLAIAHKRDLQRILNRRGYLRRRYHGLGQAMDIKDREVDRRFANVVKTQDFLDQNIAPEATVARIGKQLHEHWQGQPGYVKAMTEGDPATVLDSFFDDPFPKIWSEVNEGIYEPDFTTSRHGLLEDLDQRVAMQSARLQQWKQYRANMKQKIDIAPKLSSPFRRTDDVSPRAKAVEKDLVFSPRKSPRKSEFPVSIAKQTSPVTKTHDHRESPVIVPASETKKAMDFLKRRQSRIQCPCADSPSTENNDSGFSEISNGDLTYPFDSPSFQEGGPGLTTCETPLDNLVVQHMDSDGFAVPKAKGPSPLSSLSDGIGSVPSSTGFNETQQSSLDDEIFGRSNDQLAQCAVNASKPSFTPFKPALSLVERTRQSLAFASPGALLSSNASPAKRPPHTSRPSSSHPLTTNTEEVPHATLAERTRKSISFAQSKPQRRKSTRRSTIDRRGSRVYPVNQFETPHKGGMGKELTPPEEMLSGRAGYDSVFKSRPKVGFSPSESPTQEMEVEDDGAGGGDVRYGGLGRVDEVASSPLARMAGKA